MDENINPEQTTPVEQPLQQELKKFPIVPVVIGIFIVLLVVGGVIVYSQYYKRNNIENKNKDVVFQIDLSLQKNIMTPDELKERDVDGDGLSDYEELFVYETIWYKADTDEDGLSDGNEVNNGGDPKDNIKNIDFSKRPLPGFGELEANIVSSKCENNLMPGDVVNIQGSRFKNNSEVIIRIVTVDGVLTGEQPDPILGITMTDENGHIDTTIVIQDDFEIGFFSQEHKIGLDFTGIAFEALGIGNEDQAVVAVTWPVGVVAKSCMTKEEIEKQSTEFGKISSDVDNAQYEISTKKAILNLPFTVYKATFVPEGYEMSRYTLKNFYGQDLNEVAVESAIHVKGSGFLSNLGNLYAGHFVEETWATLIQIKLLGDYVPKCPSDSPSATYSFFYDCIFFEQLESGENVYYSDTIGDLRPQIMSVLKGDTLVVLGKVGFSSFTIEEQIDVMKVLNSLEKLSKEEFLDQL